MDNSVLSFDSLLPDVTCACAVRAVKRRIARNVFLIIVKLMKDGCRAKCRVPVSVPSVKQSCWIGHERIIAAIFIAEILAKIRNYKE